MWRGTWRGQAGGGDGTFPALPGPRPLFLFGVKDNNKARLATISCLEFQRRRIPFKGVMGCKRLATAAGARCSGRRMSTRCRDLSGPFTITAPAR
jgi:hypothetical protein